MSTKKSKKRMHCISILLLIIVVALLGIIIYSGVNLLNKKYYKIDSRIKNVKSTIIESEKNSNETIGWIRIQGTDIDLPIIKNEDNSYPVEVEGYGWIDGAFSSFHNNTTIMGHNIFNLSGKPLLESKNFKRFEQLMSFVYLKFAKENKYIQLTMDGEDKLYKIFMVGFIPKKDELLILDENNYLDKIKEYSIYDYDIDVNKDDKLLSLVTCTRFFTQLDNDSFYVVAREVRKKEKIENYSVRRNKRYEEVEEKLKDGESENGV